MAQGAWKDWSEGELVTEALFQDIQDSIAFIYASESAANSALTRKVEGTQFYDTGADKLKIWDGSAWQEVGTTAILQVVTGTTSTDTGAIISTSYTDTGLTASITPTATSSKILVMISQTLNAEINSGQINGFVNIVRGSSQVWEGYFASELRTISQTAVMYLDSPSTTSATAYKTQIKVNTTADSGRCRAQQDSSLSDRNSSIHLIEIAG